MLDIICKFCEGKNGTIISSLFFALSIILKIFKIDFIYPIFISILISGFPFFVSSIRNLFLLKIKNSLLISIAITASIFIGEYFAAAEIALLMAIGELLESYTVNRAKKGISKLISLTPKMVKKINIEKENSFEEISVENVKVGDLIRVFSGEIIALDGIIKSGSTSVDQSTLTGESFPVDKSVGDEVYSGCLNGFGVIDVLVTKGYEDSSIQNLIKIVKKCEDEKAPTQRIIDKWAVKLVPIALLIAIFTFLITKFIGYEFYDAINRAVTVLVVFCPCALFLSTPTAIMGAIGQATKYGVIIKSAEALEKMGNVNKIAFDKTGTLTYGRLKLQDVKSVSYISNDEILKIILSLESKSEHPIGKSILEFANENKILGTKVENFKVVAGKGIEGEISNTKYFCGTERYLKENLIKVETETFEQYRNEAKIVVLLANEEKLLGFVTLSDTLRENAKSTIKSLKDLSVETILLTGDNKISAEHFSQKLEIKNVKSEILPEEKLENIRSLKENGIVCMVGDGINDAPALKLSDVSISMGKMGSDIAVDVSDIILINDDISKIPYLKKLSNSVLKTIKFNISASLLINFLAVILSILGLLNPVLGAIVHNVGSLLVILNATLLYDRKFN